MMKNIMKRSIYEIWFYLFTYTSILFFSAVASANGGGDDADAEVEIGISLFSAGDSKSSIGNAQVGSSGVIIETEYEKNNKTFSFNYERWNYSWTNPKSLPFTSGIAGSPWSTFNTLQFGFAYEQEINKWELLYYIVRFAHN